MCLDRASPKMPLSPLFLATELPITSLLPRTRPAEGERVFVLAMSEQISRIGVHSTDSLQSATRS